MTSARVDRALPSKVPHMNIAKDGRFVCYGPAGGGYGNPLERDPADVADDVLDELITVETALRDYGVVISTKGVVDRGDAEGAREPLVSPPAGETPLRDSAAGASAGSRERPPVKQTGK